MASLRVIAKSQDRGPVGCVHCGDVDRGGINRHRATQHLLRKVGVRLQTASRRSAISAPPRYYKIARGFSGYGTFAVK